MDDLLGVHGRQSLARETKDVEDLVDRVRLGHPVPQGHAGQQFHDHEEAADLAWPEFFGVEVVDDHDVAVLQQGEHLRLGPHGLRQSILREPGIELERDLASAELVIGTEVPGAVSPVVTSPAGLHAMATRPAHSAHVGLLGMFGPRVPRGASSRTPGAFSA